MGFFSGGGGGVAGVDESISRSHPVTLYTVVQQV